MKSTAKLLGMVMLIFLAACSKDETPLPPKEETKSNAKQITSFVFKATENSELESDIVGTIDQNNKTIAVMVPYGTPITALVPDIAYSTRATVNPTGSRDFSVVVSYEVTAEDGSSVTYTATVTELPNENSAPSGITATTAVNKNSVQIDWTEAVDPDGDTITYTVMLGDSVVSQLITTSLELTDLSFEKEYSGKIIADDGN